MSTVTNAVAVTVQPFFDLETSAYGWRLSAPGFDRTIPPSASPEAVADITVAPGIVLDLVVGDCPTNTTLRLPLRSLEAGEQTRMLLETATGDIVATLDLMTNVCGTLVVDVTVVPAGPWKYQPVNTVLGLSTQSHGPGGTSFDLVPNSQLLLRIDPTQPWAFFSSHPVTWGPAPPPQWLEVLFQGRYPKQLTLQDTGKPIRLALEALTLNAVRLKPGVADLATDVPTVIGRSTTARHSQIRRSA